MSKELLVVFDIDETLIAQGTWTSLIVNNTKE